MRMLCAWTNGEKAEVHLVELPSKEQQILKVYKPGFTGVMFREYLATSYLSRRLSIVPKVIRFSPRRRELVMSYIPGQRVLEWVLQHFGEPNLKLEEFLNFEAMDTDPRIVEAFIRFRQSASKDASRLKEAIELSYARLHGLGWQHGTCDPRNVIYDGQQVYIIDFDHARPSFTPTKYDYPSLTYWFGLLPGDRRGGRVSIANPIGCGRN